MHLQFPPLPQIVTVFDIVKDIRSRLGCCPWRLISSARVAQYSQHLLLVRITIMPKLGVGLLMYRKGEQGPEVLLVHPGGPFFKNKDEGVWSLPKGLADSGEVGEQLLEVAKREFEEETGIKPIGHFDYLGSIRRRSDGKTVDVWTFAGDCDPATVTSNTIIIEWPPKTGKKLEIPEVDRADFFPLEHARTKLCSYLVPVIDLLEKHLASR